MILHDPGRNEGLGEGGGVAELAWEEEVSCALCSHYLPEPEKRPILAFAARRVELLPPNLVIYASDFVFKLSITAECSVGEIHGLNCINICYSAPLIVRNDAVQPS